MTDHDIDSHLTALGIAPPDDDAYVPVGDEVWAEVAPDGGRHVPERVRWFFGRYGGSRFPGGVFYFDARADVDAMFGWFLDGDEMVETVDDIEGGVPDDVVPIANDGGDNHVAVGVGAENSGVVYFHIHDAPLDRNLYVLADTFDQFLLSLHHDPGDE